VKADREIVTLTVAELDALPAQDAATLLESCCGSREWVRRMLIRRPFGTTTALLDAAAVEWQGLAPGDWLDAFAHHPRIGEREAAAAQDARSRAWSGEEQRGVAQAEPSALAELTEGNHEYEAKFGHIFLVCASGKSAAETMALLRERMSNDAASELRIAAGEQAKITRLRLRRLLGDPFNSE
jgi:2-oxo-4-hydroxy-4-carboxy-5-ureidoimidazoline decarboxylase